MSHGCSSCKQILSEPLTSKLEKNHAGYSGVISLSGSLIADLAKESQKAKLEEDRSQQEYEAFMAESAASRAQKVKEVEELKDTRASLSASLVQSKEEPCVSNDQRSSDGQGDECSASELRLVDSELQCPQGGPCRRCRCFETRQGRACWGRQLFVRRVKSRNRDQTHAAFQHPSCRCQCSDLSKYSRFAHFCSFDCGLLQRSACVE